jgi:hypothetical protein
MHEYKDLRRLTSVAVWCVAVYMAIELLYGGSLAYFWATEPELDPSMATVPALSAIGAFLSLLICVIVVGRWIYRASANAHAISDEMTISPGWAVGSYFIPILNLFRPYQAMREIWLASHFRGNWHAESSPGLLIVWWSLWIGTAILGNVTLQLSFSTGLDQPVDLVIILELIGALLNLPLCLALIAIMRRIAQAQATAGYDEVFA